MTRRRDPEDLDDTVDAEFERRVDAMAARIHDALKLAGIDPPYLVRYSAYERDPDDPDLPRDNLDDVPVRGAVRLVGGGTFVSPLLESPRWVEIAVQAEAACRLWRQGCWLAGVRRVEVRGGVVTVEMFLDP